MVVSYAIQFIDFNVLTPRKLELLWREQKGCNSIWNYRKLKPSECCQRLNQDCFQYYGLKRYNNFILNTNTAQTIKQVAIEIKDDERGRHLFVNRLTDKSLAICLSWWMYSSLSFKGILDIVIILFKQWVLVLFLYDHWCQYDAKIAF